MATNAKATGYLDLNIAGFDQAIKTAKNLMAGLAATFAAYKVADWFKDGVKGAVDFGKEMQSISRAMGGFDPKALLLTQKALEQAGMGAEEARGHMGDFIREGRNLSEIFGGSENYAKALESAARDYGAQADVLQRSGKALQSVWNTMESIGQKVKEFFLTMTEQFVQPLQYALNYLNEIDLASVGASFGKYISNAVTVLVGAFKNGDLWEIAKTGITLAFKEGVNWLVGGINYVAGIAAPSIGKALVGAVELMGKAWDLLFSGDTMHVILYGFLSIAAKFSAAMLDGVNTFVRVIQTGLAMAVQKAISSIPGLGDLLGMSESDFSYKDIYDATEGPISQDFIDSIRSGGKDMASDLGDRFKQFSETLGSGTTEFAKANIFDTTADSKELGDMISKSWKTGFEEIEKSNKQKERKTDDHKILTSFSGSSSKVIADNLARVGGGGNYLRQGMSLQERTQLEQLRAQKQGNQTLEMINRNTSQRPQNPKLPR